MAKRHITPKNKRLADLIPPLYKLEGRFSFIKDRTLRNNMALATQYTMVLIAIMDKEKVEGTHIASAFYKDTIVYYATIVEGCLHYCLEKYIDKNIVKSSDVMPLKWVEKDRKILHAISDIEEVYGAIRIQQNERLNRSTQFITINRASKKAGILDEKLFKKAEVLREKRNKIHLAGLKAIDNSYTKTTALKAENTTIEIIVKVEKLLNKIT